MERCIIVDLTSSPVPPQAADHIPPQAADHAHAGSFPQTFADLNIQVVGNDSVIHLDANDSVTVVGDAALTADDFLFT